MSDANSTREWQPVPRLPESDQDYFFRGVTDEDKNLVYGFYNSKTKIWFFGGVEIFPGTLHVKQVEIQYITGPKYKCPYCEADCNTVLWEDMDFYEFARMTEKPSECLLYSIMMMAKYELSLRGLSQ